MQRRGTVGVGTCLAAIVMALSVGPVGADDVARFDVERVSAAVVATPSDDVPDAPSGTVSEFYPESANLSDCVGLVEKPGCGSGSRGGWRQTAVFVVLFAGLAVILWRVSRGIKANRTVIDAGAVTNTDASTDAGTDST